MPSPSPVTNHFKCSKCDQTFTRPSARTRHFNATHASDTRPVGRTSSFIVERHPLLSATPCDEDGNFLHMSASPPRETTDNSWTPFRSHDGFELADLLFQRAEMSKSNIDDLLTILRTRAAGEGGTAPFENCAELYATIDSITEGEVPWDSFTVQYDGPRPEVDVPQWMDEKYQVFYRNPHEVIKLMLTNRTFDGNFDYTPYRQYENGQRVWRDFMSGNFSWKQADMIGKDPDTHGAMLVPVDLGSDKTTASVATGQNEFYPLYMSPGNIKNHTRQGHEDAVVLIGFLAIPKTDREHERTPAFCSFRRQLFHASISTILNPLRPFMTKPEVAMCPNGHFRRVIYTLGPYIADYPEQVLLTGIVTGWCPKCTAHSSNLDATPSPPRSQVWADLMVENLERKELWDDCGINPNVVPFTHDFPRADIHELISCDLLHQIIKGTFKDHLVTWVGDYLEGRHGKSKAAKIMADIDRRISVVPPYPGLRRFKQGRCFNQWTGNDSKALMKVYLPAIEGHVPDNMVKAIAAFLDFCYLVRRPSINQDHLRAIQEALNHFHQYRKVFQTTGVCEKGFSLPRQHAMIHYISHIVAFGAPSGLCLSITESMHIRAVKKPWRRSSRHHPLLQILRTNTRLSKLSAFRRSLIARGMLGETCNPAPPRQRPPDLADPTDMDRGEDPPPGMLNHVVLACTKARKGPRTMDELDAVTGCDMKTRIRQFLYEQTHPETNLSGTDVDLGNCPHFSGRFSVFDSAVATYYLPSDTLGQTGFYRERIHTKSTRNQGSSAVPRYDCVLVAVGATPSGFLSMQVAHVRLLLSIAHLDTVIPCALVDWFISEGNHLDPITGMWMIKPQYTANNRHSSSIIHLNSVLRGIHLLPVHKKRVVVQAHSYSRSLDSYRRFYVNKYIDYHAFETIT